DLRDGKSAGTGQNPGEFRRSYVTLLRIGGTVVSCRGEVGCAIGVVKKPGGGAKEQLPAPPPRGSLSRAAQPGPPPGPGYGAGGACGTGRGAGSCSCGAAGAGGG